MPQQRADSGKQHGVQITAGHALGNHNGNNALARVAQKHKCRGFTANSTENIGTAYIFAAVPADINAVNCLNQPQPRRDGPKHKTNGKP